MIAGRVLACAALVSCACAPREPGLKDDEHGATFFWHVAGLPKFSVTEACESETQPEPPAFAESAYLVYTVSGDGKTAKAQDCERVDVSTCKDNELDLEFAIDFDTLTGATTAPIEELSETCTHTSDLAWIVKDEGEEGSLTVEGTSELTGDDCSGFELSVSGDCLVKLEVSLELELVDKP
jgi:hypothetical protein